MPKKSAELSAIHIKRLNDPGRYAVGGVDGLHLMVKPTGAKSWILRVSIAGKRTDAGLGGYPDVGLSEARELAKEFKRKLREGINPMLERMEAKASLASTIRQSVTFQQVAVDCHQVKSAEFKNQKHAAQWINTLEQYAFPVLGSRQVSSITTADVLEVLQPIWSTIPETAGRVRQRIKAVFDYAKSAGQFKGDNPAEWAGCLQPLLPSTGKMKRKAGQSNHPSLAVEDAPRLFVDLSRRNTMSAFALHLLFLTACRSGEVRGAEWRELDASASCWEVPQDRMKADKPHVIPLTDGALRLLKSVPRQKDCSLVFPGTKLKPLSDNTLQKLLKMMHEQDIRAGGKGYTDPVSGKITTPHGLRSTFKDWARRFTAYADEVSELQLAHVSTDATRAAYARDKLIDLRRKMMTEWERYLQNGHQSSDVVPIRQRS